MIELKNISKKYGEHVIFDNVSLVINGGDFICINGVSGSGKSSLFNIIGGLDHNYEGQVLYNGQKLSQKEIFSNVSFLLQNFALLENESIYYNLEIVCKVSRINKKDYKAIMDSALSKVGLYISLDRYVYTLSGGEQQRVALARLFIDDKQIILCDEPTASLDKVSSDLIIEILNELNIGGTTILMISHDEQIINKTLRSYKIEKGKLIKNKKTELLD